MDKTNMEQSRKEGMGLDKEKTKAAGAKIKERDYWLQKLSGDWHKTRVYSDFPESKQMGSLEKVTFHIKGESLADLLRLSNGSEQRLFMILATQVLVLLHKYTGDTDILLGHRFIPRRAGVILSIRCCHYATRLNRR